MGYGDLVSQIWRKISAPNNMGMHMTSFINHILEHIDAIRDWLFSFYLFVGSEKSRLLVIELLQRMLKMSTSSYNTRFQ